MNYLVEIKNEYTITLVNILTPLIYQGIDSIYKDAKKKGIIMNKKRFEEGNKKRKKVLGTKYINQAIRYKKMC